MHIRAVLSCERAEPYLQHDTTSIEMGRVDIFRGDVPNFSVVGGAALEEGGGLVLLPVRGDVYNSIMFMAERLDVVGALHPQSVYGLRYSNENIARHNCDDLCLKTSKIGLRCRPMNPNISIRSPDYPGSVRWQHFSTPQLCLGKLIGTCNRQDGLTPD